MRVKEALLNADLQEEVEKLKKKKYGSRLGRNVGHCPGNCCRTEGSLPHS